MMSFSGRGKRGEERLPVGRAKVYIHGEMYNVINWSRHGVMVGPYSGALRAGQPFTFRFVLPMSDEDDFEFSAWAETVRVDGAGLAARYTDLNERVSENIERMLGILIPAAE
jgi:hypothetical protein